MRGGEACEKIEDVRVRPDEDSGLPGVDARVDDLGRPLRRRARERVELVGHLLVCAVQASRVSVHAGAARDVRLDATGMHGDRAHARPGELVAERLGEATHRELRGAVGALVRDAGEAEHARGVDDRARALLEQDRQEGPHPVDDASEVDRVKPFVVLDRSRRDG